MRNAIFAVMVAATSICSHAEVFSDIWYNDTLASIKKQFPKAVYKDRAPAWLQADERFIEIQGSGLAHRLLIHFSDIGPPLKKIVIEKQQQTQSSTQQTIDWQADLLQRLTNTPDEFILVEWVRIAYIEKVPISRFKARYGEPASCKFDESFEQVCTWPKRGMTASLTEDGKFVYQADTRFTKEEKIESYRRRNEATPAWLNLE